MPLWVPFATAAISTAVTIVIFLLTGQRERAKSKREANAKFRSAFAVAITQMESKDAHFLMHQAQEQHDVAIHEFRRFVPSDKVESYDKAVERFRRHRSELTPAILAVANALSANKPIDTSETTALREALDKLLDFAT